MPQYTLERKDIVSFLAALFPATCLSFGKGHNIAPVLFLLVALVMYKSWRKVRLEPLIKCLVLAFVGYYAIHLINMFVHSGRLSDGDQASRFLLVVPILMAMIKYPLNIKWVTVGIVSGGIVSGLSGLIQFILFEPNKGFAGQNGHFWLEGYMPIQSGNMAMTLGCLSLTIAVHTLAKRNYRYSLFAFLGALGGISAAFYSTSRGGWLALPIVFLILTYNYHKYFSRNQKLSIISAALFLFCLVALTPKVQHRIDAAFTEAEQYQDDTDKLTSIGIRFELWKGALYTFKEHPVLGAGEKDRLTLQAKWGEQGLMDYEVATTVLSHSHNQYLDDLSVRGLVGLVSLLALFGIPIAIFRRYRHNNHDCGLESSRLTSTLGLVHIFSFMAYCTTQALFSHNSGTIFYAMITAILVALSYSTYNNQKAVGQQ